MIIEAVIGSNYGDEGKGIVTDWLCLNKYANIVILNNGGCQRGHTVELKDGTRHVFHHFGSGTLRGVPSYFSRDFRLNPMEFIREKEELKGLGFSASSFHDPRCIIQLPSDIAMNWHLERNRESRNGSVGCGIWETERRIKAGIALTFDDFYDMSFFQKIKYINTVAKLQRKNMNVELYDIFMNDGFIRHFIADCMEMNDVCKSIPLKTIAEYDRLIIENGQGLMLDELHSNDPEHSTPSRTGALGVAKFVNDIKDLAHIESVNLNYVTRTYVTRHGNGRLDNEISSTFHDMTNITNEWQGSLRFAKLDVKSLYSRIDNDINMFKNENTGITPTKRVILTHMNEVPDCQCQADAVSNTRYAEDILRYN